MKYVLVVLFILGLLAFCGWQTYCIVKDIIDRTKKKKEKKETEQTENENKNSAE